MVKIDITLPLGYTSRDIKDEICRFLPLSHDEIKDEELIKRTLDLSDIDIPKYKCTVAFCASPEREAGLLKMRNKVFPYDNEVFKAPSKALDFRPVVVGMGPAGLFAALALAEAGARPIILERGLPVRERMERVNLFNTLGVLDTECNIQFGEGGAGTFSDGKLKFGAKDKYKRRVINELISSGATEDIAYADNAHLGTDKLPLMLERIRERMIDLGGTILFGSRMHRLVYKRDALVAVEYSKDEELSEIATSAVILSVGHSARDTIRMLYDCGVSMESRGFGIGVRVEHPREYIDRIVYRCANDKIGESASYHLVTHLPNGRSVYSFCMCPGGTVVSATSNEGHIVTNGMSEFARKADNSNAALLVSVTKADLSDHALGGIELQEKIEKTAFSLYGSYIAPSSTLGELVDKKIPDLSEVKTSYPRGTREAPLESYLPGFVTESLAAAISDFDKWLPGYYMPGAKLTGPETRTTSPVRIIRGENGESVSHPGLYPTGEGAGYAGGIVSSAVDGLRQAERLLGKYAK